MAPTIAPPARKTVDDLMRFDGKAELINGEVVPVMSTGRFPNLVAGRIYFQLFKHAKETGVGEPYTDGMGFTVPELPNGRESFSPNVAYYSGEFPDETMRLIPNAPLFAAEVRSENDYKPSALREQAAKRADYIAAGTLVVWDVDPVAGTIDCYRSTAPLTPQRFGPGDEADAEPAVPGWRVAVDWLMRPGTNR